jgi:hypothetical protein
MGAYTDRAAFSMVPPPAMVMIAIQMFANHNVIAIADDNLCRRRNNARKNSTHGSA